MPTEYYDGDQIRVDDELLNEGIPEDIIPENALPAGSHLPIFKGKDGSGGTPKEELERPAEVRFAVAGKLFRAFRMSAAFQDRSIGQELEIYMKWVLGFDLGDKLNKTRELNDIFLKTVAFTPDLECTFQDVAEGFVSLSKQSSELNKLGILREISENPEFLDPLHQRGRIEYGGLRMIFEICYSGSDDREVYEDLDRSSSSKTYRSLFVTGETGYKNHYLDCGDLGLYD